MSRGHSGYAHLARHRNDNLGENVPYEVKIATAMSTLGWFEEQPPRESHQAPRSAEQALGPHNASKVFTLQQKQQPSRLQSGPFSSTAYTHRITFNHSITLKTLHPPSTSTQPCHDIHPCLSWLLYRLHHVKS